MVAIRRYTKQSIKAYLEVFVENLVKKHKDRELPQLCTPSEYLAKTSSGGDLKPFHAAIIPDSLLRINAFERGFSTSLGSTFEECARLIAADNHKSARRGHSIKGMVSREALAEVERQVSQFEHAVEQGATRPCLTDMISAVLDKRESDDLAELRVTADLYIEGHDGRMFYFEVKSPKPNKGQCLEITQRLLRFHLLSGSARPKTSAYFAMGYNPNTVYLATTWRYNISKR